VDNELQAALEASKQMNQNTLTEEEQLNIALAMSMDPPKKKKVAKIKEKVSNQSFWKFKFILFELTKSNSVNS
jgi:hypothetical protein